MPNATVDDQDIRCEFGGDWTFFRGESGPKNASGWFGQTYASCGGPGYWEEGKDCDLRVPFVGCARLSSPRVRWQLCLGRSAARFWPVTDST